jgi:hypothetical protein
MDGQPKTTCAPTEIARMGRCLSGNEKKINSSPASTSVPLFKLTIPCVAPGPTAPGGTNIKKTRKIF